MSKEEIDFEEFDNFEELDNKELLGQTFIAHCDVAENLMLWKRKTLGRRYGLLVKEVLRRME